MDTKTKQRLGLFLGFIILFGGGFFIYAHSQLATVPPEFKQAREDAAKISKNIVDSSNKISSDIGRVNEMDKNGDFTDAAKLTEDLLKQSQDIRKMAADLSAKLEIMTGDLSGISTDQARELALQAITQRLAMITRLINYSDYLGQLLSTLKSNFTQNKTTEVHTLVDQINGEVQAINAFDTQARQSMESFDKITR